MCWGIVSLPRLSLSDSHLFICHSGLELSNVAHTGISLNFVVVGSFDAIFMSQ